MKTSKKFSNILIIALYSFAGVAFLIVYLLPKKKESGTVIVPSNATTQAVESTESTTNAICVVCGKSCNYSNENSYSAHHLVVDGQRSSDVVCSAECDIKLREKITDQLQKESAEGYLKRKGYTQGEIDQMQDPNQGDPEIKESSKKVLDYIKEHH